MDKLNDSSRPLRNRALLLGTALASSLVMMPLLSATPTAAQVMCDQPPPPQPINDIEMQPIICVNTENRTSIGFPETNAITLITFANPGSYIRLDNSGMLTAEQNGIFARTIAQASFVEIDNTGSIDVDAQGLFFYGIGIFGQTFAADSPITINNAGDIGVRDTLRDGTGIFANGAAPNNAVQIFNSGDMEIDAARYGNGIEVSTQGDGSAIDIVNEGAIDVESGRRARGISALTFSSGIVVDIDNFGDIGVKAAQENGAGIYVRTIGPNQSNIDIANSGDLNVIASTEDGYGIVASTQGDASVIDIANEGGVEVQAAVGGFGIAGFTSGVGSSVDIVNSGGIDVNAGVGGFGIYASTSGDGSAIEIVNNAGIGVSAETRSYGIYAYTSGGDSGVTVANGGGLTANGNYGVGILATTVGANSPIEIVNSGHVFGSQIGIQSNSNTSSTITNLAGGSISAGSGLAIDIDGAAGSIFNAGLITGFVDLTDNADLFVNQSGGVFQAFGVSDFGDGDDLFTNEEGGVVDTADNPGADEDVQFVGLETFQNFGTISLLDGAAGDLFTISNTPGGTDLEYEAGSFLAVDAFLGGPGSRSDIFRIDGNVSGVTDVLVTNTNPLPGTFQPDGITVVQVRGDVDPNAFRLANGPIDTGFFNFDLFFEPRNGGPFDEFELRSFPGGGAFLLPQLITASQDIWHQTNDTWFDRSADLRTQLWRNGGSVPGAPGAMYLGGGSVKDGAVVAEPGLSPAVWAKVSHGELEHEDSARTSAFGRSFNFNLDRELYIIDVQSGVDFALKGVMNSSDVLLLSVFGGGVSANLTYDNLDGRRFDYEGGQVGVAATYLSGGLFVDALFNAQFLQIEPKAGGFNQDLDADTYGFRVDTGYRFESGRYFFEPLLTLAYVDSDIDGFSFAGNTVSFQAEDSLRGRVGLRAGTSLTMGMARFEPFVIASLWGELSDDDNRATLVSNGARFGFRDEREDSWGEVSLGTNTFLFGSNAVSAFSKVDLIFGEDTEGYMASGGFRVQW